MAKSIHHINLEQGDGKTLKIIPVETKTTTDRYLKNLIEDYRSLNMLDGRPVRIVYVKPLFS